MKKRLLAATLAAGNLMVSAHANDMETVLVTATQQPAEAASMPLFWSLVEGEELDFIGAIHINEAFQRIPGGWIARNNGQESLTALRSPVLTGAGSCGAFFMAGDGISLRAPGFCNVNQLFDANTEQAGRLEVIKGPATALYGSGAMHGVINVISQAPASSIDHRIAVEGGPHDYYRGKYLYSNTYDAHGVVVAINGVTDDGYRRDSGYDQQKMTLRHDYTGDGWSTSTVLEGSNLNQETASYIEGYKSYKDSFLRKENFDPDAYRDAESWRAHSTFSLELDEANTVTVTPYWRDNDMDFLMHFLPWQPVEENGHHSYGLSGKWYHTATWMTLTSGIDYEFTDAWLKETQEEPFVSPNQPEGVHYDYQVDGLMAAAYAQLDWDLAPRWNLSTGARFEYNEYDYDNKAPDGPACEPIATACRFYRPSDSKDDFDNWSLNLGLLYDIDGDNALYLRLAQGFRAPQATELYRLQAGQENADLDSEELNSVELGARGVFGSLYYNVGVYHMEKDEVIFQDSNRQNISGAQTIHTGIDLSLRYQITDTVDLAADWQYAEHEYDSRTQLLGSSGDIKGNTIDTAPENFGSLRLGWNVADNTRAELEWIHMDSYYLDPDNEHEYDGHDLFNLRLTTQLTRRLALGLRALNLTDKQYAERGNYSFGNYSYSPGEERALYVELEYRLSE